MVGDGRLQGASGAAPGRRDCVTVDGQAGSTLGAMKSNEVRRTYRWMAPLYDPLFRRFYQGLRADSIRALDLQPSETVVLVGVGTGLDIPLLPRGTNAIGIDMTPEMLRRAARRGPGSAGFVLADGAALPIADGCVSAVIFHLVLSVAPDPVALLAEAARILRPGGRVAILDHFAPAGRVSWLRRVLGRLPAALGTHMDRRFEDFRTDANFRIVSDLRMVGGLYQELILERR